jgi:hypothetical protein
MAGFITRHANLLQTRADRIKELQADNAKIQKDFDLLLVRDTATLKRLIDAQAQLEAVKPLPDEWESEKVENPSDTGKIRNRWLDRCATRLREAIGEVDGKVV